MPQMAPIMWTSMFFLFSSLLYMASLKMYFMKESNLKTSTSTSEKMNFSLNWKW